MKTVIIPSLAFSDKVLKGFLSFDYWVTEVTNLRTLK